MAAFMERQQALLLEREAIVRREFEEKMEQQRQEMQKEAKRQQAEAQKDREVACAKSCVSEGQLELLQTRLDALHQAKLLTDAEIRVLEDVVADYIGSRSSLHPSAAEIGAVAEKVKQMVGLSEGMGKDRMLARQLRRKFAAT